MTDNNAIYNGKVRKNSGIYIFILILSFVWLSFYPTMLSFVDSFNVGYGNALTKGNFSVILTSVITDAIFSWIVFEILFWIYRYFLSFKIYSFIVPSDSFRAETRIYFIFRNVILGLVYNFCFLFPYLFVYRLFFDLLITLVVLILYVKHLLAAYSETVVGHFVFKNFCYPIFIYEAIELLFSLGTVIL